MAKKDQEITASMIDTFREFKETKNIDRTTLVSVLDRKSVGRERVSSVV